MLIKSAIFRRNRTGRYDVVAHDERVGFAPRFSEAEFMSYLIPVIRFRKRNPSALIDAMDKLRKRQS